MRPDVSGAVRIAWSADGYVAIKVLAPRRSHAELDAFVRGVADEALVHRDLHALTSALRRRFDGTFDVEGRAPGTELGGGPAEPEVLVTLHPPRGEPNPD